MLAKKCVVVLSAILLFSGICTTLEAEEPRAAGFSFLEIRTLFEQVEIAVSHFVASALETVSIPQAAVDEIGAEEDPSAVAKPDLNTENEIVGGVIPVG